MEHTPDRCQTCGDELEPGAQFCRSCGTPVAAESRVKPSSGPAPLGTPVVAQSGSASPGSPASQPTAAPVIPQPTPPAAPKPDYRARQPRRGLPRGLLLAGAGVLAALLLVGAGVYALAGRGGDDTPSGGPAAQAPTPAGGDQPGASTPGPATTQPTAAAPTPTPTPGPPPTATPRNENGLLIVDEVWVGRVVEPGGLRIRSAPEVKTGNVVGSVAQEAQINVEGRVLNGQEAEQGKGTVWLIVGPSQYIYAAAGYVERIR